MTRTDSARPMSRPRLLALLAGVAAVAVCLVAGLGYALVAAFGDAPRPVSASSQRGDAGSARDQIAGAPMLSVGEAAAHTPNVAVELAPAVALPRASGSGALGVRTGFPRTPLGAVAQLAAIDARVLSAMSVPVAVDTYTAWALPGGVGAAGWAQTENVRTFLTSARQAGQTKDASTFVSVVPAAYQVKGADGEDWVVACVLFDVTARITDVARMGYGTCERMQWTPDGWRIAPGTPPAPAPSTWPGSELAVKAGWLPLTRPEG